MVNKKGYFYLIEMFLVVLIIIFFVSSMPTSKRSHTSFEEQENLKAIGYGTLFSLEKQGIIDECIKENISDSDFVRLREHIKNSIDTADVAKIEYKYSNASIEYLEIKCLNSTGQGTRCGEVTKKKNEILVSILYTFSKNPDPVTIKLYLRRYGL